MKTFSALADKIAAEPVDAGAVLGLCVRAKVFGLGFVPDGSNNRSRRYDNHINAVNHLDSSTLYRYNNIIMQPLDRNGNIPLVYQLGEAIRDKIGRGEYSQGDSIPTEDQLQKFYGVSRTTVRLALAKLLTEAYTRLQHAKGTYVNPRGLVAKGKSKPFSRDMFGVKSTTQIILSAGAKKRCTLMPFSPPRPPTPTDPPAHTQTT